MAYKSENDLQAKIEQQNVKINKYEAKLRDVVSAYKSLQKEKVALEEIVKNITSDDAQASNQNNAEKGEFENVGECVDPLNVNAVAQSNEAIVTQWKDKVSVMTKALATISEEKSRMETNFQGDKKRIIQEKDELAKQLADVRQRCKENETRHHEEIEQYKRRLRSQQLDHEKEQHNQQLMLRELQNLVANERVQNEQLETQLDEAQLALAIKESQSDKSKEFTREMTNLFDELKSAKSKLKAAEEIASKPSPLEIKLKTELQKSEAMHRMSLIQEQHRAEENEERLNRVARVAEQRVAELEGRLAELSEIVGNYERQRQQDFTTIQRLKERNSQLDIENTSLAKVASCVGEKDTDESNLDLHALKMKINKLKGMMKLHDPHSDQQFDNDANSFSEAIDHSQCQRQILQIKEEFENYKTRTQSILRDKHENDSSREVTILRSELSEVKEKLKNANLELENVEKQHRISLSTLHTALDEMKFSQKQQIATNNAEWQSQISAIEQQMQRQRERSFALIEEKEKEIELYKLQLGTKHRLMSRKSSKELECSMESRTLNEVDMNLLDVAVELSKLSTTDKKEVQFLHYAQEMARKDVEISNLRKAKHQLDINLREQELASAAKDDVYVNQLESVTNQVLRLERNNSREGANLEYLKNVVLSYMLSSSSGNRQHMLNAISVVLKFSSKELESVKQYNSTWWWSQS